MNVAKIKLISFDLWETLISDDNQRERNKLRVKNLKLIFEKYNYHISKKKLLDSLVFISKTCTQNHNLGIDKPSIYRIKELLRYLNIDLNDQNFEMEILSVLDKSFLEFPPSIFPFTTKILDSLRKNYLLCLTSNTGITSPEYYKKYLDSIEILNKFNKLYLSNELLIAKPSSLIFKRILDDFKLKPKQVIHVGDNLFTDIFGAKKEGINTLYINKRKSVQSDLNIIPDYTLKDISGLINLFN